MKLESTRSVLKSFLVNPKIKMNYPITSIVSPWDSVIVFIHMDKLGEEEFNSFGVRKMDTLLSAIDVYEDPVITFEGNNIVLTTSSDKQEIRTSTPELNALIKEPKYEALKAIENSPADYNKIFDVVIDKEDLIKKSKIQKLFGLEVYRIKGENDNCQISVCNLNGSVGENEATSNIDGTGDGEIVFSVEDISMLPILDYKVSVYERTANGSKISIWRPVDIPEVEVIVTQKQ
jgi:hypothetical protein